MAEKVYLVHILIARLADFSIFEIADLLGSIYCCCHYCFFLLFLNLVLCFYYKKKL